MLLTLCLLISLFLLFYSIFVGDFSRLYNVRHSILQYGSQIACAFLFFFGGSIIFQTSVAGIFWGISGWLIPAWIMEYLKQHNKQKIRNALKEFVSSAIGLYLSGQLTDEVIKNCYTRVPEPLASDLQDMIGAYNLDPNAFFPDMFERLADKYELDEFRAVASILAAAEKSEGPLAVARGFKNLARAMRKKDQRVHERKQALQEPKVVAMMIGAIIFIGLVLDVTLLGKYFESTAGRAVLSISSALTVIFVGTTRKLTKTEV